MVDTNYLPNNPLALPNNLPAVLLSSFLAAPVLLALAVRAGWWTTTCGWLLLGICWTAPRWLLLYTGCAVATGNWFDCCGFWWYAGACWYTPGACWRFMFWTTGWWLPLRLFCRAKRFFWRLRCLACWSCCDSSGKHAKQHGLYLIMCHMIRAAPTPKKTYPKMVMQSIIVLKPLGQGTSVASLLHTLPMINQTNLKIRMQMYKATTTSSHNKRCILEL